MWEKLNPDMNYDYDNATWQRKGQEIMILPPYEFCPEVCIANVYLLGKVGKPCQHGLYANNL